MKFEESMDSVKLPEKLPPNYHPKDDEEYMNPHQLKYFQEKLLDWKNQLLEESTKTLTELKEENWHKTEFYDQVTDASDFGIELRKRDRERKLISKIDQALARIDEGEYGYCKETGEKIGLKRLEARPTAEYSIEAQERHEQFERQHSDDE